MPSHLVLVTLLYMPPLSFEARATSGLYDRLAVSFDEKRDSLATVDYGIHFVGQSAAWRNGDIKNHRTTFYLTDQPSDEPTDKELTVNIIGEVSHEGCELGACGNVWLKPGQRIVDKDNVKDVLFLIQPSMATPALEALYENQVRTIQDLEDKIQLPVPKVRATLTTYPTSFTLASQGGRVTHCVRPIDEGMTIVVTMPLKYRVGFSFFIVWRHHSPARIVPR